MNILCVIKTHKGESAEQCMYYILIYIIYMCMFKYFIVRD